MKKGRVLTYGLPTNVKIALLETLPLRWIQDDTAKAEVTAIAKAVDRLRQRRNNFVHGVWGYHPDDTAKQIKLFYFDSGERKILAHKRNVNLEEVLELAVEIDALHERVIKHLQKADAYIP